MEKRNLKKEVIIIFWLFLIGSILGYIFEMIVVLFGTISWDYSYLMFNINGRTSLLHCSYWGIAGIIYVIYIDPFLEKLKFKINQKSFKIFTITFVIFILFDISISLVAANRQTERRNNIFPENKLDLFLDKYYSDEYMDKVYANKKDR